VRAFLGVGWVSCRGGGGAAAVAGIDGEPYRYSDKGMHPMLVKFLDTWSKMLILAAL